MTEPVGISGPVLVTGATGFVGRRVVPALRGAGYDVRPVSRSQTGDIDQSTDWSPFLEGCKAVVHLAARVHVMDETSLGALPAFRKVNVGGTVSLANQAKFNGIKRFIYVSSIKVVGEKGFDISPLAPVAPQDAYATSKAEAEDALKDFQSPLADGMQVTILRPPLIYGPGVGANFARMMRWLMQGVPLPLAKIKNQRSLIYVDNFADAVRHALIAPPGTYHPRDAMNLSTSDLLHQLALGLGKEPRLFPMPLSLLFLAGSLTGQTASLERLTGSFTCNGEMAGWSPPVATRDALFETARSFLNEQAK